MITQEEIIWDVLRALRTGDELAASGALHKLALSLDVVPTVWVPGNAMAGTTIALSEQIVIDPLLFSLIASLAAMFGKSKHEPHKLTMSRRGRGRPSVAARNRRLADKIEHKHGAERRLYKDAEPAVAKEMGLTVKPSTIAKARQSARRRQMIANLLVPPRDNAMALPSRSLPVKTRKPHQPRKQRKQAFNSRNMLRSLEKDWRGKS
jgi:hypothetical protein